MFVWKMYCFTYGLYCTIVYSRHCLSQIPASVLDIPSIKKYTRISYVYQTSCSSPRVVLLFHSNVTFPDSRAISFHLHQSELSFQCQQGHRKSIAWASQRLSYPSTHLLSLLEMYLPALPQLLFLLPIANACSIHYFIPHFLHFLLATCYHHVAKYLRQN